MTLWAPQSWNSWDCFCCVYCGLVVIHRFWLFTSNVRVKASGQPVRYCVWLPPKIWVLGNFWILCVGATGLLLVIKPFVAVAVVMSGLQGWVFRISDIQGNFSGFAFEASCWRQNLKLSAPSFSVKFLGSWMPHEADPSNKIESSHPEPDLVSFLSSRTFWNWNYFSSANGN